jgi:hypothetical protein
LGGQGVGLGDERKEFLGQLKLGMLGLAQAIRGKKTVFLGEDMLGSLVVGGLWAARSVAQIPATSEPAVVKQQAEATWRDWPTVSGADAWQ